MSAGLAKKKNAGADHACYVILSLPSVFDSYTTRLLQLLLLLLQLLPTTATTTTTTTITAVASDYCIVPKRNYAV